MVNKIETFVFMLMVAIAVVSVETVLVLNVVDIMYGRA